MAGGTLLEKGHELGLGKVWTHLDNIGVEYCVLRLTLVHGCASIPSIYSLGGLCSCSVARLTEYRQFFLRALRWQLSKMKNTIYTATGDGLVPFVSAGDIAAVAFRLLTDEKRQPR